MKIIVKRVYEKPGRKDGVRILVDGLWPRGLSKKDAEIDLWMKSIAPSNELRKWYQHDSKKWLEFKKRYYFELMHKQDALNELLMLANDNIVTILYASKEREFNNAVALKEYLSSIVK